MRFTFTFNGISSDTMGVIVSKRPPIKSPQHRMLFYNVDGTYGSTSKFLGFQTVDNEMELIIEAEDYLDDVKGWLTGKGELTISSRPGQYQVVHMIETMEFERLPRTNIFTGVMKYTSYYPIWKIKGEVEQVKPLTNHGTSWNYAYTIENKGTFEEVPHLLLDNLPTGEFKLGDGNIEIHEQAASLRVDILSGEVIVNGTRKDKAVTWKGDIKIKPGITKIYSQKDISGLKFIEPSTYI